MERAPAPGSEGPLDLSLLPLTASVDGAGVLSIGGVSCLALAEEFGTPIFVYDEEHLRARCREAVEAFGDGVAYASKAFLCLAMARLAHEEGMRLDVATGGELAVAEAAGIPGSCIVLHGNNKSTDELRRARAAGARIVVDSFDEIDRLIALASEDGVVSPVLLRVNPGVEAHTHEYVRTGQVDSKFGLGLDNGDAARALALLAASPAVDVVGVHAHLGSQILRLTSFGEAVHTLAGFVGMAGVDELCVGGGLGIAYVNDERAPSITEWAHVVKDACRSAGIRAKITAEPGRAIVGGAAVTLYRVGTVKDIPSVRAYVAVDGGMSDNPRPITYGTRYEAFLPRAARAPRPRTVTVVGKHCESGDIVVKDAQVPDDLHVDDVLCTPVTGAYGYSQSSTYNRVPRPPVVFVRDGVPRVVARRETYEDLLRLER